MFADWNKIRVDEIVIGILGTIWRNECMSSLNTLWSSDI